MDCYRLITLLFLLILSGNLYSQSLDSANILKVVEILSHDSLEGRKTGCPGNLKAHKLITSYYQKYNLLSLNNKGYQYSFISNGIKGLNAIAYIKGRKNPDTYILLSAHFDHVGVEKDKIYNGADDNASGIGGLFAAIEYFSKNTPENSIIFAAFDGEELGLLGSNAFVKKPPVSLKKIILDINMDMISRNSKNELFACGTSHNPTLKPLLEECSVAVKGVELEFGHDTPDKITPSNDWTYSSDHASFHKNKIPSIYFGVEDHEDYHQPTDDFEKINPEFCISSIKLIIKSLEAFDKGNMNSGK